MDDFRGSVVSAGKYVRTLLPPRAISLPDEDLNRDEELSMVSPEFFGVPRILVQNSVPRIRPEFAEFLNESCVQRADTPAADQKVRRANFSGCARKSEATRNLSGLSDLGTAGSENLGWGKNRYGVPRIFQNLSEFW